VTAGIALRFTRLGGQSLWVDEIITLKNSFVGEDVALSSFTSKLQGPLVGFMMHFWASVDSSDAFMRVPFAVAGTLTVLAIYLLARSLYDSWTTLHTVFVASFSPILIWYSQEIRGYAFVVLFSVLATYFFIHWLARPTTRNAFFYGVFIFAGLVSNLSASFVAAAHLFYLILTSNKRKLVGRWLVTIFVVLLAFSPWVREIIVRVHPERALDGSPEPLMGGSRLSIGAVPYAFFTYSVGYTLGPSTRDLQATPIQALAHHWGWIGLAGLVFGIPLLLGIVRMARTDRNLLLLLLLWLLIPLLAVSLLAARNVKVFSVRYALVSVPAYAMLIGQGLAAISKSRLWFFLGLFTVVTGFALYNYFLVPAYGKDDSRQAAGVIKANFHPGDVVVGVYSAEALAHYLMGVSDVATFGADDLASEDSMIARCETLAAGGRRVWLALCREWAVDSRGLIKGWFDRNLRVVSSQVFPGVRLYLYEKGSE
jgi:mannosyltransferase